MSSIEICWCILILSGSFTLFALGCLFLKIVSTLRVVDTTMTKLNETVDETNKTLNNVNYKLTLLDTPVQFVSNIFDPNKKRGGLFGWITSLLFH